MQAGVRKESGRIWIPKVAQPRHLQACRTLPRRSGSCPKSTKSSDLSSGSCQLWSAPLKTHPGHPPKELMEGNKPTKDFPRICRSSHTKFFSLTSMSSETSARGETVSANQVLNPGVKHGWFPRANFVAILGRRHAGAIEALGDKVAEIWGFPGQFCRLSSWHFEPLDRIGWFIVHRWDSKVTDAEVLQDQKQHSPSIKALRSSDSYSGHSIGCCKTRLPGETHWGRIFLADLRHQEKENCWSLDCTGYGWKWNYWLIQHVSQVYKWRPPSSIIESMSFVNDPIETWWNYSNWISLRFGVANLSGEKRINSSAK